MLYARDVPAVICASYLISSGSAREVDVRKLNTLSEHCVYRVA